MQTFNPAGLDCSDKRLRRTSPARSTAVSADSGVFSRGIFFDGNRTRATSANFIGLDLVRRRRNSPESRSVRIPAATGQWYTAFVQHHGPLHAGTGNRLLQLQDAVRSRQPDQSGINEFPASTEGPHVKSSSRPGDIPARKRPLPFHNDLVCQRRRH